MNTTATKTLSTKSYGWETTRQKGKKRFILFTGILQWGIPMFIAMTLFTHPSSLGWNWISFFYILGQMITWTFGGICFGWIMWNYFEKKYQKQLAQQGHAAPVA